jgi:hypothetical protein
MRFRLAPVAVVLSLGLVAAGTTGCRQMAVAWNTCCQRGALVTYEQYQQIDTEANPKLGVEDVMEILGKPMEVHDRNGARVRLDYHAFGMDESLKRAEFHFDKNEKLLKKELW